MNRILIVEDEKLLSDAYHTILTHHGYKAVIAQNGHVALDAIAKDNYGLILLDLKMPHMSGLEFLRRLDPKLLQKVPVIVFSNLDNQLEIDEAFNLGAQRYILKSWASPEELVRVVRQVLPC